jgi:hypothetical protein
MAFHSINNDTINIYTAQTATPDVGSGIVQGADETGLFIWGNQIRVLGLHNNAWVLITILEDGNLSEQVSFSDYSAFNFESAAPGPQEVRVFRMKPGTLTLPTTVALPPPSPENAGNIVTVSEQGSYTFGSPSLIGPPQMDLTKALSTERALDVYLINSNVANFPNTGGFSLSYWIKFPVISGGNAPFGNGSNRNAILATNAAGQLSFFKKWEIRNQGTQVVDSKMQWYSDAGGYMRENFGHQASNTYTGWQHVIVTWDGNFDGNTNHVGHHKNGGGNATWGRSNNKNTSGVLPRRAVEKIYVLGGGEWQFGLGGALSHVALWNKKLTQAEINAVYNNGTVVDLTTLDFADNLIEYWPLGAPEGIPTGEHLPENVTIPSGLESGHDLSVYGANAVEVVDRD